MNLKLLGSLCVSVGIRLFRDSNSITLIQGTPGRKRQAIVGIITTGTGVYLLGRSDGYISGYDKGVKDASNLIFTIGHFTKEL